jgi:hypothetical protein
MDTNEKCDLAIIIKQNSENNIICNTSKRQYCIINLENGELTVERLHEIYKKMSVCPDYKLYTKKDNNQT